MTGKIILVTGAGSGIGKDAALALMRRGHTVIATTYTEEQAAGLIRETEGGLQAFKLDITLEDDRTLLADMDIDVLINNAAIGESGSLAEVAVERIRAAFEVNVFATLSLSQIAIRKMIPRGGGTVLFISSIAGRVPFPFLMPYSMTKFALSAAAAGLRQEMDLMGKNINISVIEPGAFHTGFNQSMTNRKFEWMDEESLFSTEQIAQIKKRERKEFKMFEEKNTRSIIKKIIQAAEADRPKLRYVAPWIQGFFIQLKRILGT